MRTLTSISLLLCGFLGAISSYGDSPLIEESFRRWQKFPVDSIRRIVLVLPVYREFSNGNLQRFLYSVKHQLPTAKTVEWDVVLLVNDHATADDEGREENQALLRVFRDFQPFPSRFRLHLLDKTGQDFARLTIGEKREFATRFALGLLREEEMRSTAIAQLDADCRLSPQWGQAVESYFKQRDLDYLLMDIELEPEANSPSVLFGSWIYDQLSVNENQTRLAYSGVLPGGPMPRVVARASVVREAGPIPPKAYAEDSAYFRKLQQKHQGAHVFEAPVVVSYRSRLDGFDSARIHQGMHHQKEVTARQWKLAETILSLEGRLSATYPAAAAALENEYQFLIAHHVSSAQKARRALESEIERLASGISPSRELTGFPLLDSHWFGTYLQRESERIRGDGKRILANVAEDYPHQMDCEPTPEIELNARFTALRRWILFSRQWNPQALEILHCGDHIAKAHRMES